MRLLLLAAALAAPLSAQPAFGVADPVVSVDGRRVEAALAEDADGHLTIAVWGEGTYRVAERPFEGARHAGQFDGRGLYFAVDGRSVRLISATPVLPLGRRASAYVSYAPGRESAPAVAVGAQPVGQGPQPDPAGRADDAPRAEGARPLPSAASLPGFDMARLANPDAVRRRLGETGRGAGGGDVQVLFQADSTGRVVRTAVVSPAGNLGRLAEEVVREMRFRPPVVDGRPRGLRAQVVVRFGP